MNRSLSAVPIGTFYEADAGATGGSGSIRLSVSGFRSQSFHLPPVRPREGLGPRPSPSPFRPGRIQGRLGQPETTGLSHLVPLGLRVPLPTAQRDLSVTNESDPSGPLPPTPQESGPLDSVGAGRVSYESSVPEPGAKSGQALCS